MKFSCYACGQTLEADQEHIGLEIQCPVCQVKLTIPDPNGNDAAGIEAEAETTSVKGGNLWVGLADKVGEASGLEKLEGFSTAKLFREVFRHHSPEEAEDHFAVGTSRTTPPLHHVHPGWPTPWAFLRVVTFSLILSFVFYWAIGRFQNPILIPGWIFVGCFGIPLAVMVFFIELNILRNVSLYRIASLVLLGGLLSLVISLFLFDFTTFDDWIGPMSAGAVEEVGKLLAVVLFTRRWRNFPWILNGMIFGAAVGTGFSAFESAGYVFLAFASGESLASEITMMLRSVLSPFTHTIWTAAAAGALWRVSKNEVPTLGDFFDWRFLRVFLIVMLLHALWNSPIVVPILGGDLGYLVFRLFLGLVGWIIVLQLLQSGIREVESAKRQQSNPGPSQW